MEYASKSKFTFSLLTPFFRRTLILINTHNLGHKQPKCRYIYTHKLAVNNFKVYLHRKRTQDGEIEVVESMAFRGHIC